MRLIRLQARTPLMRDAEQHDLLFCTGRGSRKQHYPIFSRFKRLQILVFHLGTLAGFYFVRAVKEMSNGVPVHRLHLDHNHFDPLPHFCQLWTKGG